MAAGRKLYVAHLHRICWNRIRTRAGRITKKKLRNHIERQWGRISEQERAEVLSYLKCGLVTDRDELRAREAAQTARDKARTLPQNDSNEKVARYRAFLDALAQYKILSELSASANTRWQRFSRRLRALPARAQSQEIIDAADDRAAECATYSSNHNDAMEELEKELEAEVPLDAFRRRKVPRDWIVTAHGTSLNVVDTENVKDLLESENKASNPFRVGMPRADATNWAHARLFSTGSFSTSLWVRTDGNGKITNRLVRKDVIFPGTWFDVRMWAWMKFDEDNNDAMPWELHCHGLMTENDGSNNVVKLRETRQDQLLKQVDKRFKRWKVYTDFCPNGDLSSLIEHYAREIQTPIPQPFILYVAECLFNAGLAMTKVSIIEDGPQIVHRDLKPGNVFLDNSDPNTYPDYPRPLLGDFGFAISTSAEDPRNPRVWAEQEGVCETGYKPPELITYAEQDSLGFITQTEQLLEHTNVWQAGLVLRCLVTQNTPPQAIWLGDGTTDTTYSLQGHAAADHYDKELIKLIEDCMRYDCRRRPTLESLLARINLLTGGDGGKDLSRAHRTAASERPDGEGIDLNYGGQDQYAVGMTWPAPPPDEGEDGGDENGDDADGDDEDGEDEDGDVVDRNFVGRDIMAAAAFFPSLGEGDIQDEDIEDEDDEDEDAEDGDAEDEVEPDANGDEEQEAEADDQVEADLEEEELYN